MKAMVLAAGLGSRLYPLTQILPKPLLPIVNKSAICWILEYLAHFEVQEVVINLHHLAPLIPQVLGTETYQGIRLHYSYEQTLLGSVGAIKKAERWLQGETFILYNGDTLVDLDLSQALDFHRAKGAMATLVLRRDIRSREYGQIQLGPDGRICKFLEYPSPSYNPVIRDTLFTGIHILEPDIFRYIPPQRYCCFSRDIYPEMIKKDYPIYGYLASGYWIDIGAPIRYLQANKDLLGRLNPHRPKNTRDNVTLIDPVALGRDIGMEEGVQLGPWTVVGDRCYIGAESKIIGSVIWDHTVIGKRTQIKDSIIGPGIRLIDELTVEKSMMIKMKDECLLLSLT